MKNKIVIASIWNLIGTFLLKGITFLSVPIFTRLLNQHDYGLVSTYNTYISLGGIVIGLSLNTSIANARIDFSKEFSNYLTSLTKASFCIFLIEFLFVNFLNNYIKDIFKITSINLNLILMICYSEYIVNSYYKANTIDFKFKKNVILTTINSISVIIVSIILIKIMDNPVTARLMGQGFFLFIVSFLFFINTVLLNSSAFKIEHIKYALPIAIPNIFHQLSQIIMSQSDRLILLSLCGASTTAKYSVVYTFGLALQMIWNAANEVWVPWLYRKLAIKNHVEIIKMSEIYICIFSVITILALLILPDIMLIVVPKSYHDAQNIMVPVILAIFFIFIYSFFANQEIFYKKNRYLACASFIAATINIGSNYLFIPMFGYKAAAYTTLISYVILMCMHYYFSTWILKINVYKFSLFLKYILIVCLSGIFANVFLNNPTIRYAFVCIIVVFIILYFYRNKNRIIYLINTIKE